MTMEETTQQGESEDATPPVINTTFDWTNQTEVRNQQDISNAELNDHQTNAEMQDMDEETNLGKFEVTQDVHDKLDKDALKAITVMFGPGRANEKQPKATFITKLERILGDNIPQEIFKELVNGGIITPQKLINTFGGGLQSMTMFMCYHKPSLFLARFDSFTHKLFVLSRLELNLSMNKTEFSPKEWTLNKKRVTYDRAFEKKSESACKTLRDDISDTEYSMATMKFMIALRTNIHDTAYNVNPPTAVNKGQLQQEDGSTIISSKSVPVNINVVDSKYITGRKYRTSGNLQKLTHPQSHLKKGMKKPRYSVAVSPHDPTFRPDINLTVPGVTVTTTPKTPTNNPTSQPPTYSQGIGTMYGVPYTSNVQAPSTPQTQTRTHADPTQIPTLPTPQAFPSTPPTNPPPYYVQYPGRHYTTYEGHLIIAPPPNTATALKRTPLPSTFKWKETEDFEVFHDAFISYMGQQRHLQYIYQERFISIYLQHGHNPYLTLGIATYQNVHSSVKYISIEQFDVDSNYLFHALQQCITGRGSEIFNKQHLLFDGVTTYKILTDKFRFGGDRETYKNKLINIIQGPKYYTGYTGGPLKYLDTWEQATSKFNRLAEKGEHMTGELLV